MGEPDLAYLQYATRGAEANLKTNGVQPNRERSATRSRDCKNIYIGTPREIPV